MTLDEETIRWLDNKIKDKTYHNYQHAVTKILKEKVEETRFEHYNCYDDHVTIFDVIENHLVDVYYRNERLSCDYDQSSSCRHVTFAYTLKPIIELVNERKLKPQPT